MDNVHHHHGTASTYTEMEGNLHIRAKKMNMWKTRRFVLSGQVLQYFSLKKPGQKGLLETFSGLALAGSKKKLTEKTDHIFELVQCSIKPVHEYLSSRPHSFQIASASFFLLLHADSHDEMQAWVSCLRYAAKGASCSPPSDRGLLRARSFSGGALTSSPSSARITVAAESFEDDILEFAVSQRSEIQNLMADGHGRYAGNHWIVQSAVSLGGKQVPRGSLLVAINGHSVHHEPPSSSDVLSLRRRLHSASFPLTLQFLRCRSKVGALKLQQSYDAALGSMLKLTTRVHALLGWKELECEIDGDLFVSARVGTAVSSAALAKWGQSLLQSSAAVADATTSEEATAKALKPSTVVALSDGMPSVRLVHAVLSGRPHCFLLTTASTSLLLQAASDDDMIEWMGALVHAIDLAHGVVSGSGAAHPSASPHVSGRRPSGPEQSSFAHPSHRPSFRTASVPSFFPPSGGDGIQRNAQQTQSLFFHGDEASMSPPVVTHPTPSRLMESADVVDILAFCQHHGWYTEALQLMVQHTTFRAQYWPHIFAWALPPPATAADLAILSTTAISEEDTIQLHKDIPRTATWLASSDGAPPSTVHAPPARLDGLRTVLHAFIARSCASTTGSSHTSYLQGMNGIAFVLLEVFADDVRSSLQFLHGLVHGALPTIFHTEAHSTNALVQTGAQLESMVAAYLPALAHVFETVGLPVFLLAYKWFPTLFSDVSLQANRKHNQLQYNTLLVAWDVCMLVGVEGIYVVALALFAAADGAIRALGPTCLAEDVSGAFTAVLSTLAPHDFVLHVCEVIETCQHPLLLQMRDAHHRRLHDPPVAVKDLDTGQLFGVTSNAKLVPLHDATGLVQLPVDNPSARSTTSTATLPL